MAKKYKPKRQKVPDKAGKRHFTKTAKKVHPKNFAPHPMRGGIRF